MAFIASASVDSSVKIWDGVTMRVRHSLVHQGTVTKVRFLKNSTMLVTSSADKTLRLWEARTGECLKVFKGHQETVLDFDLSGARIVSGSDDGTVLVWAMDV
jgi:WD40 repeat protein